MRISDWSSDVCSSDLSAGSVNFNAARDEASSSSNSHSVAVGVSTSTKGGGKSGGIEAGGGFSHADAQSSTANAGRSEEHTSELQSLMRISYAVFCLKKKTRIEQNNIAHKQTQHNIF